MTSYAWAVPGAKAICIVHRFEFAQRPSLWERLLARVRRDPEFREIVTIKKVVTAHGKLCLVLRDFPFEYVLANNFRPLVTRTIEDDIAIFAPWLNTREVAQ